MITASLSLLCVMLSAPPADHKMLKVRSRDFDVHYQLSTQSPLTDVELWYTLDRGQSWHRYGMDADRVSPFAVSAPAEGLCGLYIIAANESGQSSPPPQSGDQPHQWVLIDYTPPLCQLHEPKRLPADGVPSRVQIRWAVIDDHLDRRPISLSYRGEPDGEWNGIARRLSNAGSYKWQVPDDVSPSIELRLSAVDRAGNRAHCQRKWTVRAAKSPEPPAASDTTPVATLDTAVIPTPKPADRRYELDRIIRQAQIALAQGNEDKSLDLFHQAVRMDPHDVPTLVQLGGALYALEHLTESEQTYRNVLAEQPGQRDAIIGLARTLVRQRRFEEAERLLDKRVDAAPDDLEAWLHYGDVAVYRGRQVDALQRYRQARSLADRGSDEYERAMQRIESVAALTQRFSQADRQNGIRRR